MPSPKTDITEYLVDGEAEAKRTKRAVDNPNQVEDEYTCQADDLLVAIEAGDADRVRTVVTAGLQRSESYNTLYEMYEPGHPGSVAQTATGRSTAPCTTPVHKSQT